MSTTARVKIYDLDRLLRSLDIWVDLRKLILETDTYFLSLISGVIDLKNIRSRHNANMAAVNAENEAEVIYERCTNGAKRFITDGVWIFGVPVGYKRTRNHEITFDATITHTGITRSEAVKQALEGYAHGTFSNAQEARDFLIKNGLNISKTNIDNIIRNTFYIGRYSYPRFNVSDIKGKNIPPLISQQTYDKIMERLTSKTKTYNTASKNDFPLTGWLVCPKCGKKLKSAYSKARNGTKHGYYFCTARCCGNFRKDQVHTDFENYLKTLEFSDFALEAMKVVFEDHISKRAEEMEKTKIELNKLLLDLGRQEKNITERMIKASNETAAEVYEKELV